jgi:hypothetical protein
MALSFNATKEIFHVSLSQKLNEVYRAAELPCGLMG